MYSFVEDVDEKGNSYISVDKNNSVIPDEGSGDGFGYAGYQLILKSERLGIEKRLSCRMSEEKTWVLTIAEENNGEENS